ncbi:hypothetical protein SLEP1_g38623 [Rubroshorea leprosula]|uniref:TRF2/HOY1 PH-like domain-containing protein n=1 Tax=Rubroshorea leprosula TaxID=152421 RepID=A0AAV5KXZ0_9ROSI|nr:hypothetical protein SLEP1_g38623 [Rubroshorea leprosula]
MEGGDIGCKEDNEGMKSIVRSEDDKASCSLPVNGAQNSKKEDEDSVLLKDPVFREFYDSFLKGNPSPTLDLKLAITSQLLDQINTALSVEHEYGHSASANVNFASTSTSNFSPQPPSEKWKAANNQAKALIIGSFMKIAEVPNDLVVKIYYAKRRLIWEIMYDRLKNKIEIQWADIAAFKAYYQADGTEVLEVELSRPPQFFHEPRSHPRSHTQWRATQDFTNGEALTNRRHKIICAPGDLFKDLSRLLQCDERLYNLRNHDFPSLDSPFFESRPQITNSNDQFQTISPSDHAQRLPVMNSGLSMQQTTTLPLQVSDGCIGGINVQAGEDPRILYLESGMNTFPDSSRLTGNSFRDCNVQFTNNYADGIRIMENYSNDIQGMNNFGNNGQVMNSTAYGNNILAANYPHQGAEVSIFPGYEYHDHHMHSSERLHSMDPFVNQYNGGIPVMHNNGGAPYGEISGIRMAQVLQPGQNLNSSGGFLNRQNVAISAPVIDHSMFMPNNYQNNIPYYPRSVPNLKMRDPASANFNPWDRLDGY